MQGLSAAMVESAILGTSFEDALGRHLTSSLIASLGALGANEIGGAKANGLLTAMEHKIAHAVLGCAMGAASADSSAGCAPGAVGAVIGELVAEWYADSSGYANLEQQRDAETDPIKRQALVDEVAEQKRLIIGISELAAVGGTAVLLQSGAEQMQLAKMTANNAAANNYLNHTKPSLLGLSEKEQYDSAAAACGPSDPAACRKATELAQVSRERDQQLQQVCEAGPTKQCAFFQDQARAMGNNVYSDGNFVWANSPDVGFGLNVSTVSTPGANPVRTNSWHGRVSQSTSEGLALGTGVGTPGAAVRIGTGVVRGARAGSQAVANAARAEAQLLQFGYYRWAVPAIPGVLPIVNNPQNVQNAADFGLSVIGENPGLATNLYSVVGDEINDPGKTFRNIQWMLQQPPFGEGR